MRSRLRVLSVVSSACVLAACASHAARPDPSIGSRSTGTGTAPAPTGPSTTATAIAGFPDAASSAWDQQVKAELLRAFDADRSGRIERTAELRRIPCDVWQALDHAVSTSVEYPGDGVAVIYGFTTDKGWVGHALGIAEKLRPVAADAVEQCGIELTGPTGYDAGTNYDALPEVAGDRTLDAGP